MIILASASPRRELLMRTLGVAYRVVPSRVQEGGPLPDGTGCRTEVLALRKATDVASRIGEGLVLGADTIVECDGQLLGKPRNSDEARRFLNMLSGRSHLVLTGLALVDASGGRVETGHEVTEVSMRALSGEEIDAYVKTGEPLDKAGGYAIQEGAGTFVVAIKGSFTNVVGMPLGRLCAMLLLFGIDPLSRPSAIASRQES